MAALHGDYHPGNLLLSARKEDGIEIIDWSFAEAGEPRLELAWTLLLVGSMAGERAREDFLEAYEAHASMRMEHLTFFEGLKLGLRMLTLTTWLDESVDIPVPRITRQAMHTTYKIHVLNPYRRLRTVTGIRLPTIEALNSAQLGRAPRKRA